MVNVADLFEVYQKLLGAYGFDSIGHAIISDHPELNNEQALGLVHICRIKQWADHYLEQDFATVDPVHKLSVSNAGVYVWDDFPKYHQLSNRQRRVFDDTKEFSLFNGATVSVHGQDQTVAATLLSSSHHIDCFDPATLDIVKMAAYHFHFCFLDLMEFEPSSNKPLSSREQEVLKWLAQGLTKSCVGDKLNMSSHTVDYHLRNILKKLDAKNTVAATALAIKQNLIEI